MSALAKHQRKYRIKDCVTFMKSNEPNGCLSNMTMKGMSLDITGYRVTSSENLYQALKFSDYPDIQQKILRYGVSSFDSKKIAWDPSYRDKIDQRWNKGLSFTAMRYVTAWKMSQNIFALRTVYNSGDKPIVEISYRDSFWGAIPDRQKEYAEGCNFLGRIFMEHRMVLKDYMKENPDTITFDIPGMEDLRLCNEPLPSIVFDNLLIIKPREKPLFMQKEKKNDDSIFELKPGL